MRKQITRQLFTAAGAAGLLAAVLATACGGGSYGGGNPASPSPSSGGGTSEVAATITITSSGVDKTLVRIDVGQKVRFVNNDNRSHQVESNPHPTHTDCPPLNDVGMLSAGQSRDSAALTKAGTCRFHDHLNSGDSSMQGQILVGVAEPGPGPTYVVNR